MTGTVKRIVFDKGFGFLVGPTGTEYFFHYSAYAGDFAALYDGASVTFLPTDGPKGPRAEEVTSP